jgi:hypothetical protein
MKNTERRTQLFGRAALVAMLVAPSLGAQDRWEARDQGESLESRRRDSVIRRDVELRRADESRRAEALRREQVRREEIRREEIRREEMRRDNERRRDEERRLFTWRGTVDDDARIYIRAGRIESDAVSGREVRREQVSHAHALPRREGTLRVHLIDGRGRVHVIQQPNARNNYTAIVRVKDSQYGADSYRFAAYFDPADDWRNGRGPIWDDRDGDVDFGDRILRWSGSVDGDLRIVLRPGTVGYSVASGEQPRGVTTSGANRMPRQGGQLGVSLRQGRGSVVVIQQPSSYNSYTAIVRVLDHVSGYGYYDFDLIWR